MNNTFLLADSGGSKTSWIVLSETDSETSIGPGLNLNYFKDQNEWLSAIPSHIRLTNPQKIYFFGAGISSQIQAQEVSRRLASLWPKAIIQAHNDLMAACLATAGTQKGYVAILGTGTNACLFNGETISHLTSAPGYIIGDEGSGSWIGKRILRDFLLHQLPNEIHDYLCLQGLNEERIVHHIYRNGHQPHWIAQHAQTLNLFPTHPYVTQLLTEAWNAFEKAFISTLPKENLPIHLCGGIANAFKTHWKEQMLLSGKTPGNIVANPTEGLISYFKSKITE
jgi:glucosamine kinase